MSSSSVLKKIKNISIHVKELITEDEEALNIEDIMNKIVTKTTEIIEDDSTDTSDELTGKDNDLNIPVDKYSIMKEIFKSFNSLKANMSLCSPDALPDLYKLISKVSNRTIKGNVDRVK